MNPSPPDPSTLGKPQRKVRRLTRDLIAEAVLQVGFENLTITAVADRLSVAHASLYRHVGSRDDLVVIGVERLLAMAEWPPATDQWRVDLEAQAWLLWRLLEGHPGLSHETAALERDPWPIHRRMELVTAHLGQLGFGAEEAELAVDLVYDLVFDVFSRTAFIMAGSDDTEAGPYWFGRKLDVVLAGIERLLQPGDDSTHHD